MTSFVSRHLRTDPTAPAPARAGAGRARRRAAVGLAALALVAGAVVAPSGAGAAPSDFGIEAVEASLSSAQAGAHADLGFTVEMKIDPDSGPDPVGLKNSYAAARDIRFELPAGLTGDPNLVSEQCTVAELIGSLDRDDDFRCPNASQVGLTTIHAYPAIRVTEPVYQMVPPGGDVVARLGFIAGIYPIFIDVEVRSESDYGLVAEVTDAPPRASLTRVESTTWGVPADPVHDTERCTPYEAFFGGCTSSPPRPPGSAPLPFLTNPTRCGVPLELPISASSWVFPDVFDTKTATMEPITGCELLPFNPSLSVESTSRRAAAPAGLDIELRLPAPAGIGVRESSHMRDVRIDLPEGMAANPAAADGLEACSAEQLRLGTREPSRCPDAAKLGSAEFEVAGLARRLEGAIYLRTPAPPERLLRFWVVADDQGAHVKLPGEIELDPATGRVRSAVLDLPQFAVREAKIHFKSGPRAALVNPPRCATYHTDWEIAPWSGTPPVSGRAAMAIDEGCDTGGFAPGFSAGVANPTAGSSSAFVLRLTRRDGEQNFHSIGAALPPGLLAKLAGIPRCTDQQAAAGACPDASRVGSTTVATGAGPTPLFVPQPGKDPTAAYLAGPYKGAPFSLVVKVPAQAGPFDLGHVSVRNAIYVDPTDAHVTVKSDPLPQLIQGIPLGYRDIRVTVDREAFMRAPTSCDPMRIAAELQSAGTQPNIAVDGQLLGFSTNPGQTAQLTDHFQLGGCEGLPYKPRLKLRLIGPTQTRDGGHPGLIATATQKPGEAGIEQVKVALPLSLALDPDNAQALCEYEDGLKLSCPASSIIGQATAVTPLLNEPLTGPVYFVKNVRISPRTGRRIRTLPTLLVTLTGENGVKINLRATSDVDKRARLVSTFTNLPDAPVSSFKLALAGGRDGILVVTKKDVCRGKHIAQAETDGHNGKTHDPKIRLATPCVKPGKPKRRGRTLRLPVRVPQAGTLSAGGGKSGLAKTTRRLAKPGKTVLTLKPTKKARRTLAREGKLRLRIPVSFTPRGTKQPQRTTTTAITLRR